MSYLPKVIFIDWNGTISHSRFWEHLEDPSHPNNSYFKPVTESLFVKHRSIISDWMLSKLTIEDICKLIAEDTNLDYEIILKEFIESCQNMKYISDELPDLIRKLQSKGIKCVIATDNMDSFDRFTVPSMNLTELFDGILNSYSLKSFKYNVVDKELPFFEEYLSDNNLKYSNVVLIDDSIDRAGFYEANGFKIINVNKDYTLIEVLKSFL